MMQVRPSFRKVAKAKKTHQILKNFIRNNKPKTTGKGQHLCCHFSFFGFLLLHKKSDGFGINYQPRQDTKSKQQRNLHPKWKHGRILGKHQVKDSLLKDSASSDTSPFSIIQTVFKTIVITDILGCLFPSFTKTLPKR